MRPSSTLASQTLRLGLRDSQDARQLRCHRERQFDVQAIPTRLPPESLPGPPLFGTDGGWRTDLQDQRRCQLSRQDGLFGQPCRARESFHTVPQGRAGQPAIRWALLPSPSSVRSRHMSHLSLQTPVQAHSARLPHSHNLTVTLVLLHLTPRDPAVLDLRSYSLSQVLEPLSRLGESLSWSHSQQDHKIQNPFQQSNT